jgi:hypothetical protein
MDNEQQQGAGVTVPTDIEILEALRQTRTDLDCDTDEARAVMALKAVYQAREDIQDLKREIDTGTNTLREVLTAMVMSRHSGDRHAESELEARLRQLGVIKGRGKE